MDGSDKRTGQKSGRGRPPAATMPSVKTMRALAPCCCRDERALTYKPAVEWTRTEALAIAKTLRRKAGESEREIADAAIGALLRHARHKDCFTEVWEMLADARSRFRAEAAGDVDADADDADFDAILDGDGTRVQFETPNFIIDYTTDAGAADQIQDPTSDAALNVMLANGTIIGTTVAGNGVPDFVEMLGIWLEHYLQQYVSFGFNTPILTDGGGNPIKLDVTIRMGGSATSPGGAIGIEDTLAVSAGLAGGYNAADEGLGVTPGHELFHQVQYTYNSGFQTFLKIYKEGTARWAEDTVNDAYNRYNKEVPDYLNDTTATLFSDTLKYETVLFWKYLTEQLGTTATEPQLGVDAIISLWQNLVGTTTDAQGIAATDATIAGLPGGVSLQETFADFAVANFAKDLGAPFLDPTYDYLEDEEPRVPGGQVYTNIVPFVSQTLEGLSPDFLDTDTVDPWGIHYYVFDCEASVQDVTVHLAADAAFTEPFYRVLEVRGSGMTVHEGASPSYSKSLVSDVTDPGATPIDQVVVIVGAYAVGGSYDLTVSVNEGVPSVMLVIDHSGSMATQDKIAAAQDAASLFVDVAEANGVPGLGAVGFSTTAALLPDSALAALDTPKAIAVKDDIDVLVPTSMTSIGHGLEVALGAFSGDPVNATNEVIVLLSDGQENTAPMIADVQDDLLTQGIGVFSVGLGTDAAIDPAKLEDVAVATGGDFRMTDDPAVLQEFYLQIVATTVSGDMDASDEDADADVDADSDEEASVAIEWPTHLAAPSPVTPTKGRPIRVVSADRILTVVATAGDARAASFDLALVAPDGTVVTERSAGQQSGFFYRRGRNYVMMAVPLPFGGTHSGTWRAYGLLREGSDVELQIRALLKSGLRLSAGTDEDTLVTGARITLVASVRENHRRVTGATVRAYSDRPLLGVGNYLAQQIDHPSQGSVSGDALSPMQLKLNALLAQTGPDVFGRDVDEIALTEEAADGSTLYINDALTATTPGSHTFRVVARGQTSAGEPFTRYVTFTKVARVDVDPAATRFDVKALKPGSKSLAVTLTPADARGNLLGPGFASEMHVVTSAGARAGAVVDHNDGTYSVQVDVGGPGPARVSVVIGGEAIAVPSTLIDDALSSVGTGGAGAPDNRLQLVGLLALIAFILALVALILAAPL